MSSSYSDEAFAAAVDEIETLLGDLYGVEAVADAVIQFSYQPDADLGPKTTFPLTIPAAKPFEVYPDLPMVSDIGDGPGGYQGWFDSVFAAGAIAANATGSWLKNLADNYYLVDASAITTSAQQQMDLTHDFLLSLDSEFREISGNLAVHWEGDSKEEFFEWFASAGEVVAALMMYADCAQLSAGAAGDVIAATQKWMLQHVENGRDAVEKAVATWREDNDVFPFKPGSGFKFSAIGSAVSDKIDVYTDKIPAGGLLKLGLEEAVGEVPYVKGALLGYEVLTVLDGRDTDPAEPKSAAALIAAIEDGLRDLAQDGDDGLEALGSKIKPLARDVESDSLLVLPRLPRSPAGDYTP